MKYSGKNLILRGIVHVVFFYISCYIAEIWIAFLTGCDLRSTKRFFLPKYSSRFLCLFEQIFFFFSSKSTVLVGRQISRDPWILWIKQKVNILKDIEINASDILPYPA